MRHTARHSRVLAALFALLMGAFLLTAAPPAQAHNVLESTSPADGSTVTRTPSQVTLTFNNPSIATGTVLKVIGPSGNVAVGKPELVDDQVVQKVEAGAPAGHYTVKWRVTSIDGHPISGSFSFTSEQAAEGSPPATSAEPSAQASAARPAEQSSNPEDGGGSSAWLYVLGAVVVIIIASGLVATRRRRS